MEVVFIITGIILIVSIIEYVSTKSWQQVTSEIRNELVFEGRNKDYGAYQIRKDYDRNFIFIIIGIVLFISLIFIGKVVYKKFSFEEIIKPKQIEIEIPIDIERIYKEKEITPTPSVNRNQENNEKTKAFNDPIVVNKEVETKIASQDELEKIKVSINNNEKGDDTSFKSEIIDSKNNSSHGEGNGEIETFVDVEAMFPGGILEMKKFISRNLNYPQEAIEQGIEGKCFLKFVIEADGKIGKVEVIRGLKACPECNSEAERVIKSMPNFLPAKKNGKAVRFYFQLPITFELRS